MFQRPPIGPIGKTIHPLKEWFVESEREREPHMFIDALFAIFRGEQQQFPQARVQTVPREIHTGQSSLLEPVSAFAYVKMG